MLFKETQSIYLQIADRLCDEILRQDYQEEERIPSVREYAAKVEVNVNTIVRSYEHLQRGNIIYNKRGLGYFVSTGAIALIREQRRELFLREELPNFFTRMEQLHIPIDEIIRLYREQKG